MGAFDRNLAARLYAGESAPTWIEALRETARSAWVTAPWPTRKTEAWKYTALDALGERDYLRRATAAVPQLDATALIPALEADRIVFVNGVYQPTLSSITAQAGVRVVNFRSANSGDRATIDQALGRLSAEGDSPFAVLNGCWLDDGVLLHLDAGVRAKRAVHVVHVGAPQPQPFAHAQRLLAVLGRGADVDLVEQFVDLPDAGESLVTGLTELRVGEGARIGHYRLHAEDLDLCRRARASGATVACANDVQVVHVRGVSSRARPLFVEWHKHRGFWRYFNTFEAPRRGVATRGAVFAMIWGRFPLAAARAALR